MLPSKVYSASEMRDSAAELRAVIKVEPVLIQYKIPYQGIDVEAVMIRKEQFEAIARDAQKWRDLDV